MYFASDESWSVPIFHHCVIFFHLDIILFTLNSNTARVYVLKEVAVSFNFSSDRETFVGLHKSGNDYLIYV